MSQRFMLENRHLKTTEDKRKPVSSSILNDKSKNILKTEIIAHCCNIWNIKCFPTVVFSIVWKINPHIWQIFSICLWPVTLSGQTVLRWSAFLRSLRVVPSHAETIWSPWLYPFPKVFPSRWWTNPFICMARYTSLHLPQDWDCVRTNSWLMSCLEAVPTRKLANT